MNNLEFLIPITLFVCITYAIKAVVDARVPSKSMWLEMAASMAASFVLGWKHHESHGRGRRGGTRVRLSRTSILHHRLVCWWRSYPVPCVCEKPSFEPNGIKSL